MAIEITDKTINSIIPNGVTVIDFWAPWCGPCRMLSPIIDQLSCEYENNDSVLIGKLNVDKNPNSTATYGIRGIPAVLFFKNGELVDKIMGANSKNFYQEKIESLME